MGSVSGKNIVSDEEQQQQGGRGGTYRRKAYHAGSWYEDNPTALHRTLQGYLDDAATTSSDNENANYLNHNVRAVIVPHAGYRFSGPTAAYSYRALSLQRQNQQQLNKIEHILVLHPAHHVYLQGCAVSGATHLETPIGNLTVDDELRKEILALRSGNYRFSVMDANDDDEEHSGEMQYPYLAEILLGSNSNSSSSSSSSSSSDAPKVLPIMCGALSTNLESIFGQMLAPIVARSNVVCVISSDFCHWGSRFRYQPTPNNNNATAKSSMPIHQFIREMDHQGMDLIALQEPGAFADYLKRTKNTICGRHAISVWLQAIHHNNNNSSSNNQNDNSSSDLRVNFVKYAQSSPVQSMSDSSVSYASAVVTSSAATATATAAS